jgi:outer membrane receptor protein involved in Fe transport
MRRFAASRYSLSASVIALGAASAAPALAQTAATGQQIAQNTVVDCAAIADAAARASCVTAQNQTAPTAPPASAPATTTAAAAPSDTAIFVTGSRIRRPNLESVVPITSVGGEAFFQTGRTSVGDTLNELPQMASTFSTSNSTRFLGTAGLNLLDLRGLGTARTLTLVNGRRHVGGDALGAGPSVDINTIPADLIDRVDVVTGGSSAVYGSDAIAGVVNFILKRDFQGIQLRGQGGITKYSDLANYFISGTAGQNFADGRGNVAVNLEYSHQGNAYASGRPNLRVNSNFVQIADDDDPAPDNVFVRDRRFATFNNGGDVPGGGAGFFDPEGPLGDGNTATLLFLPDGTLIPQTGTFITGPGFGGAFSSILTGGNGSTGREGTALILSPVLNRYSANLLAHYTVSDAFEPFIEAKYVRTDSRGGTQGPFFTAALPYVPGIITGSPREIFLSTNPYLTNQARNLIRANSADYYSDLNGNHQIDSGEYGSNGIPDTDEFGFAFSRSVTDFGNRDEKAKRETYRVVVGSKGTFNDDWSYEVSVNYGKFKQHTDISGNVNIQRYLLAIDAVRDPATGNIVCRSKIDPSAAAAYEFPVAGFESFAASQLANDVAQCQPVNLFGAGNVSQAALNYILQDATNKGAASQFDITGFMNGDTSGFLNLPGGPIGFVLGAEYRSEKMSYQQDPLIESGLTFYNGIGTFSAPANKVKEAFGEIRLPILKDTPFFHELTATGAARVSDYTLGHTGTVWAYNAGLEWSPIRDIRLRGNYSRAVRAPNLGELFFPLSQNFAPGFEDPCSLNNINAGSANRVANCAAAGVPPGFNYQYSSSLQFQSGGNQNLEAEKSDSITLGGIIQPRFLPGFAFSADYFDIKVKNVITSPTAQQVVNACYDLADISNQFCSLFQRNPGPTDGPRGEEPGRILEGSLQLTPLNYAALKVRGIDFDVSYRKRFGFGLLDTKLTYTHYFQNDQFLDPTDPGRADQILKELATPQDAFLFNADFKRGVVTLGYKARFLSHQLTSNFEDYYSKQGRPPQNPDVNDIKWYSSRLYHNVRAGIEVSDKYNFYLGVDNLTNELPPLGLTGVGAGSGIYDNRGRFYYAGFVAKFR